MAITRAQQPRQMYGLGSFVKKITRKATRPITKVASKLVPKEIAGIMRTAAPFLPKGYREAAYLLGTAKQTGRISPVDLALTLGPTIGEISIGKGDEARTIGQRLGDLNVPFTDSPFGDQKTLREVLVGDTDITGLSGVPDTSGIIGKGGKMFQFGVKDSPKILDTQLGNLLLGNKKGGFSKSKIAGLGLGLLSYVQNAKTPEEAGTALAEATGDPDNYERGKALFSQLPQGIFDIPEEFRLPAQAGGLMRENYAKGSDMKMAEFDLKDYMDEFEIAFPEMKGKRGTQEYMDMLEDYFRGLASKNKQGIMTAKEGGRANLALGTMPTAQESGLGGLPIEADMRYTGGFMPYGAKEKADDVPARLSKNEFVFTADAVRAAGGGSVNEGAKKMYQTMKQLEAKPEAKGMMA